MTHAILSSGGMDSYLLAQELREYRPLHVFVDVGQQYATKERAAAELVAYMVGADFRAVRGADLSLHEHSSGIIPFRNAHLILAAAQLADHVYLGVIAHEVNSDKSEEFLYAMERVLDISHRTQYWTAGRTFRMHTPLRDRTKTELVRNYLEAGGMVAPLLRTVSCYSASAQHCGACASCFKRWVALRNNNIHGGQVFDRDPVAWRSAEHWRGALAGYHPHRADEVRGALRLAGVDV